MSAVTDFVAELLRAANEVPEADFAHGLKTPLTILSIDALTLRDMGETQIAEEIERTGAPDACSGGG